MKVLVVGGGGREHAVIEALAQAVCEHRLSRARLDRMARWRGLRELSRSRRRRDQPCRSISELTRDSPNPEPSPGLPT